MSKNYKEEVLKLAASLVESAQDREERNEFVDFIERTLGAFPHYFNSVVTGEIRIAVSKFRFETPEEYQDNVMQIDRSRRVAHEAMMAAITALNRQSRRFGLTPLYEGDESDRYEAADFCEEFCCDIFNRRYSGKGSAFAEGKTVPETININSFLGKE